MTAGEHRILEVLKDAQQGVLEGKAHRKRLSLRASAATRADCQAGLDALQRVVTYASYAPQHLPEDRRPGSPPSRTIWKICGTFCSWSTLSLTN
jgi:hypothetical protein